MENYDAISRLDKIRQIIAIPNAVIQEDVMKYKMICEVMKDKLPSVTQKSGKWIPIPYTLDYETDAECSLCRERFIAAMNYNYCPNCGARMVEPQESEEISETNMKMWEELFKAESEE